jgi:integrase
VDADRHLVSVESSMLGSTYMDAALSRVTVGEWSAQWLAGQVQLKPSTLGRYEGLLRVQVLPTWERVPLSFVTHANVSAWVATLSSNGLAGSTVRQAHRVFSRVLAHAVRDGRLQRNPADGVPLPRARRSERRFLTHEQVAALAQAAGPSGVDLARRRLTIAESVTEVSGRAVFGTPKTHQVRSVPVPRFLIDEIAGTTAGKGPEDLVFTSPGGGLLRLTNFRRRVFDPAAAAVGLAGLTPHELRHTAASFSAGANVKAVQRLLGHASAAMTLDVYSGLFEDDLDAVAERLHAAAAVPRVCPGADEQPSEDDSASR